MFGDSHILKVAEATNYHVTAALYKHFYSKLCTIESDELASRLAVGIAMHVLHRPADKPEHIQFRKTNAARIAQEVVALQNESTICDILSGAAYNMGYGRYVASGGGRLNNRFVGFIRLDRRRSDPEYSTMLASVRRELDQKDPSILEVITSMQDLGLWISRSENPDEVEYLNAVRSFAGQHGN